MDLVGEVNYLLDRYMDPPRSLEEIREREEYLSRLTDQMRQQNYHNPLFVISRLLPLLKSLSREEKLDAAYYLSKLKYTLDLRRWTYDRARASLTAHRLAELVHDSVLDTALLSHIPYGGEYRLIVENVYRGRRVYREIISEVFPVREKFISSFLAFQVFLSTLLSYTEELARPHVERIERETDPRVLEYEKLLRRYWGREDIGELLEGYEDIVPKLREKIRKENAVYRDILYHLLAWEVFKYYLFHPESFRRKNPLPGFLVNPDPMAMTFLSALERKSRYVKVPVVRRPMEVLRDKLILEKEKDNRVAAIEALKKYGNAPEDVGIEPLSPREEKFLEWLDDRDKGKESKGDNSEDT